VSGSKPQMSTAKAITTLSDSTALQTNWIRSSPRGHVAQFYSQDEFLIRSLSRLFGKTLQTGGSAIVVATPEHREALARALRREGSNISTLTRQERYLALDAAEMLSRFMVKGSPDATLFGEVIGGLVARVKANNENQQLAIFGEMVALLWKQSRTDAALRLEQLWNTLGRQHAFHLYCGYPIKGFDRDDHGELFLEICHEHSDIVPDEGYDELVSEEDRRRNLAHLQQRAQALENEITERKRVERELIIARDELERRVAERTAELQQKNQQILEQAETLARANKGLRELSAHLLRAQDDERRRIARDLHDSTGQVIALLSMNLAALRSEAEKVNPALAASIAENAQIVNRVSDELRTISYLLHPPLLDEMGLRSALRWYVDGFSQRSRIQISLNLDSAVGRLSPELETTVFRVVQECLTNIHRHSGSATAAIRLLQSADRLVLQIDDAGTGIAAEKLRQVASFGANGVGLRGMRERIKDFNGEFEISSGENGTQIKVTIPLTA
jgi:signal transduction histidine kinase